MDCVLLESPELELEEADEVRYSSLKRSDDPRDGSLCLRFAFFFLLLLSFRSLSFPDNLEDDVEDDDDDLCFFFFVVFLSFFSFLSLLRSLF